MYLPESRVRLVVSERDCSYSRPKPYSHTRLTWSEFSCGFLQAIVGINDKFLGGAFIKILVALGGLIQRDDLHVDGFRNLGSGRGG
jgi:hypothetical protein